MDIEPVGFSDLTEDESFLIVLFRDWQRRGPTHAVAEHAIARLLRNDRFYPALESVFRTFRDVDRRRVHYSEDGVLLNETEETLLTHVARRLGSQGGPGQQRAAVAIRPASEIDRSGHDRLQGDVDRAYWQA
ncbi:MAG: hypothetical protein AAGJ28_09900, partial [Pseudomonadota bacterium]